MRNIVPATANDIVSSEWIDGPKIKFGSGIEIGPNLAAPHVWVVGHLICQKSEEGTTAYFLDSEKLRLRFNKKQHPHALAAVEKVQETEEKGDGKRICCVGEILPNAKPKTAGEERVVQVGVLNAWVSSQEEMDELLQKRQTLIDGSMTD